MFSAPVVIAIEEPKSPSTGKHNVNTIKKKTTKRNGEVFHAATLTNNQYAKQK